jgi:hypothetical protein
MVWNEEHKQFASTLTINSFETQNMFFHITLTYNWCDQPSSQLYEDEKIQTLFVIFWSSYSSDRKVTRLWAGLVGSGFDSCLEQKFFFSSVSRLALGSTQFLIQWIREALSPTDKAAGTQSWPITLIMCQVIMHGAVPPLIHVLIVWYLI